VAANGDGTFTLTFTAKTIPASGVTGSGRAALYGRVAKDVDGDGVNDTVRIKAAYKDFGITDTTPVARRQVVDIAKCDKCHDQVSLHGDSRTNEPGLCVICHNPNATDVSRRPLTVAGIPDPTLTLDNKKEEAIDFKRLIHGIHAARKDNPNTTTTVEGRGFREKGLVIWGYPGAASCFTGGVYTCQNDFSDVRFPGILNDCNTCHTTKTVGSTTYGTFELVGTWEVPTVSGVLGSTIDTAPSAVDAATLATGLATNVDDLNITPTAAVCSSCHDGDVAKSHMALNGALFSATQATINTGVTLEACAICHGPGRIADVKVVHGVK
jgi:OmcA/MtrC family decaheme c-type cytochrome